MSSAYTYQVQHMHKVLAPHVAIDTFVDALNPKALGASDRSQFYAPLRFAVQICGGISSAAGAIRLDVPVHANPHWLDTMKQRFAGMIGLPNTQPSKMDFRTISGESVTDDMKPEQLKCLGKLNLFVGDKLVRLPQMPEIPLEYSLAKVKNLQSWYKEAKQDLPDLIAKELVGKNMVQVNAAICMGGSVQKLIANHLRSTVSSPDVDENRVWNEFVRVHHMNSPVSMTTEVSDQTLEMVAKQILTALRDFVAAAKVPISNYIQSRESKQMQRELKDKGEDAAHYAPVLGMSSSSSDSSAEDASRNAGFDMFRKLAVDVVETPIIERSVLDVLYNRALPVQGCKWFHYDDKPRGGQDHTKPGGGKGKAAAPQAAAPPAAAPPAAAPKAGGGGFGAAPAAAAKGPLDDDVDAIGSKTAAATFLNTNATTLTAKNLATIYGAWGRPALDAAAKSTLETLANRFAPGVAAAGAGKKELAAAIENGIKGGTIKSSIEHHNPWNAQIHHTLEPLAGVYPAYYTTMSKQQKDMSKDAAFAGDVKKTYDAYHLFAGAPISPPGVTVDPSAVAPPVIPINSSSSSLIPPRPPLKRFVDKSKVTADKIRARLVPYSDIGDEMEEGQEQDSYGLPLSIDAFDDE